MSCEHRCCVSCQPRIVVIVLFVLDEPLFATGTLQQCSNNPQQHVRSSQEYYVRQTCLSGGGWVGSEDRICYFYRLGSMKEEDGFIGQLQIMYLPS